MKTITKGQLIAAAVVSMFASGCATQSAAMQKEGGAMVHCGGVNACKGQSACGGANSSCKGQNACKGQGWVPTASEKACTDQGGTVLAAKM